MSIQFQRAYSRYLLRLKGTANRWTPAEQMWTAERALLAGSGFHPWPTGRCGLALRRPRRPCPGAWHRGMAVAVSGRPGGGAPRTGR